MTQMDGESVTLRAKVGEPLENEAVRDTIIAAAHALAERNGVTITSIQTTADSVKLSVKEGQVAAMGLVSELRRSTDTWYRNKYGGIALWGAEAADGGDLWADEPPA